MNGVKLEVVYEPLPAYLSPEAALTDEAAAEPIHAARKEGRDPGGDIFIHGRPNSTRGAITLPYDWTAGCIAISNSEIREVWSRVAIGTVVEIRP